MSKAKVAVMLSGTGTTMTSLLYASRLPDCPYEIVLVASNKPEARGLTVAAAEGVATFAHSHKGMGREAHEAIMLDALRASGADYVALCGYMRILTADFVGQWAGRMLNTHPSLLPKFKGLDTHQRAIDAGDSHGGCTVHLVTPTLDDGPVLGQIPVAILPEDTADTLAQRVLYAEYQLYPRMLASYVEREMDPDWLIDRVGQLALALPETHARESHGAAGWRVGSEASGKFFAYVSVRHHGEDAVALLVKTSGADEMAALIEADPDIYYRPAYYGASGWIAIRLDRPGVDWEHVRGWLEKSWRAVAPKRLTKMLEIADQF
ncbi:MULTISPECIES: phosphoribosylglycinamide formyltransferase [Sphingobium]|uniref:phosphoribosylglycinamide formyltransferase n=1 Tax=Sphingobium TaxID=165695 RepID=UPI0017D95DC8|nr:MULTISPECIES: phosphoribosylglycinamide formyltransferase [Sphingobium]MCW2362052.1 phosphoribosylglycinamide formyltransferase-1 [Sphingobium sp. B10D3B]MCW2401269.1 phosphoribosylglycinamide formyltransferase-1 [Sphingobium sp. B10D7B]MCW2408249.1 phosphoribosylglycinamide formyltransferase-1 [Sphingobium xanthum]